MYGSGKISLTQNQVFFSEIIPGEIMHDGLFPTAELGSACHHYYYYYYYYCY